MKQALLIFTAVAVGLAGLSSAAYAQRDPAYQAARTQGVVGEKTDGYLGVVGAASSGVQAMVNSINIQRRAAYTKGAQAKGSTIEDFAFTSGCNLIAQTVPGEKYQAPDGSWKTRTSAPPIRDSRCAG